MPLLLSIPHGGDKTPPELSEHVCITKKALFDDSDAFTLDIYNAGDFVESMVTTDIARAFVDPNRSADMLPPAYPDGVIKSMTCNGQHIYKENAQPNHDLSRLLLIKYYHPYHRRLHKALQNPKLKLGLDCHSMIPIAPLIAPDRGQKRPQVNLGDLNGTACDSYITRLFQKAFLQVFELKSGEVTINEPFAGGFITQTYANKPIPWIQIELNRWLYLSEKWFNPEPLQIKQKRLDELNRKFINVLVRVCQNMD